MAESSVREASQHHTTSLSGVAQLGLPTPISPNEIAREQSLGGAIELCAKAAGYTLDKGLQQAPEVDKAQFSRWQSGTEGIVWPKLRRLMELCGNDAPILWMLYQLGYDLHSLRKRESETARELRESRERIAELEHELVITKRVMREVRS